MDLQGKLALVTGGARRIGRAIALALGRAGTDVIVHYHHSAAEAEATAGEIRALGRRAVVLSADLAQADQIAALFAAVGTEFGHLDVLVNNAAAYARTPIQTLSADQWDAHMAVNARAPALCIRHALPLMRGRGGAIINIADVAAAKGWAGYPAYCASKAALLGLTRSAARALAPHDIRVNSVSPGLAEWPEGFPEANRQRVVDQVPLRRAGRCEDVAAAVVFLAQQDYITGQELRVDGGWCMT